MSVVESRPPVRLRQRTERRWFMDSERQSRRYCADAQYAKAECNRAVEAILADQPYRGPARVVLREHGLCRVAVDAQTARDHGIKITQIGKNARVLGGWHTRLEYKHGHTHWRNGKPKDYTRTVCDQFVRSFAHVHSKRRMTFYFGPTRLERPAPKGYHWNIDNQGLRLVRCSDGADFHPNAWWLLMANWGMQIVGRIDQLARWRAEKAERERLDAKLASLADAIERSGEFKVGLTDSIDAGNCVVGSVNWAASHGFNTRAWHDPRTILQADPSNGRVRIAIREGAMRHARLSAAGAEVFYP